MLRAAISPYKSVATISELIDGQAGICQGLWMGLKCGVLSILARLFIEQCVIRPIFWALHSLGMNPDSKYQAICNLVGSYAMIFFLAPWALSITASSVGLLFVMGKSFKNNRFCDIGAYESLLFGAVNAVFGLFTGKVDTWLATMVDVLGRDFGGSAGFWLGSRLMALLVVGLSLCWQRFNCCVCKRQKAPRISGVTLFFAVGSVDASAPSSEYRESLDERSW